MIRPTPRAIWVSLGITAIVTLIVVIAPSFWMLSFIGVLALIALFLIDALLTPLSSSVAVQVELPPFLYIGSEDAMRIHLSHEKGMLPRKISILIDVNELLSPVDEIQIEFFDDQVTTANMLLHARRRGKGRIDRLWLRWVSPCGLMHKILTVDVDGVVRIIPDIRAAKKAAIEFSSRDAFFGVKLDKWRGEGSEFEALREFQAGFDPGTIDWKQSARHRLLLSRDFRTERNHQIVVAFDVGHLMGEPQDGIPKLDHAINAGLLMGLLAVLSEDQLGLCAFDSQVRTFIKPMSGRNAFSQIQLATANLDYSLEETNFTLALSTLHTQLRRRSLIILFTDFVDSVTADLMISSLERLSKQHVIIFTTLSDPYLTQTIDKFPEEIGDVARSVVASGLNDERRIVFDKLARMGVHTIETTPEAFGVSVLNKYLEIKSRELI